MAKPLQDAGSFRQEGVRFLPADVCLAVRSQAAEEGLGGWGKQAEVDYQAGA